MKSYACGLVVGKFSPLHKGHEKLINMARSQCDILIIISYSVPSLPGCEVEKRQRWLEGLFPDTKVLVLDPDKVVAQGLDVLPANDDREDKHRHYMADVCLKVLRMCPDAVFTAEEYGDGFADVLSRRFGKTVKHVRTQRETGASAVSGTLIRSDVHRWRHYLSKTVYSDFVKRICLLGGESTGKSTLSEALAKVLNCNFVPEYGRERWEQVGGELAYEDFLHIAEMQIRREELASIYPWLVCDTSPLTTLFYSCHLFGQAEAKLWELANRPYDLIVLCSADFPFVQDGTRQGNAFRELQQAWYEQELVARNIPFLVVSGNLEQRIAQILALLREEALDLKG
ncbi:MULTISPECIES: AAA family ATPase [Enterobacterales]|uniref:AAA family ATPase n=1 Tax=Enterobacterales TaxID=91347 RepID=UPI002ED7CF7E